MLAARKLPHKQTNFKPFLVKSTAGAPTRNETCYPHLGPTKPHSSWSEAKDGHNRARLPRAHSFDFGRDAPCRGENRPPQPLQHVRARI